MADTQDRAGRNGQHYSEVMEASTDTWRGEVAVTEDQEMPRGPRRPSEIITARLRQRIVAGEWAPGGAFPSVAALAEEYGVARSTIARSLRTLADEGLLRWSRAGERSGPGDATHTRG